MTDGCFVILFDAAEGIPLAAVIPRKALQSTWQNPGALFAAFRQ